MPIQLRRGREHAIIATAWLRSDPVRHLALHHDHNAVEVFRKFEQSQQNVRRNVIRKIAHHLHRLRLEFDPRLAQTGLRSEDRIEVDGQNVGLNNLHVPRHAELESQLRRQHAIEFHRDQPPGPLCQQGGHDSAARTNFEHRTLRNVP